MADAKLIETRPVALGEITVSNRLREAGDQAVEALMASIEQLGTALAPVMLRRHEGELWLIGGLHRLRAYQRLGRQTIRADIWQCGAHWARLAEIDENLAGADLGTMELAQFLAERKRVYERLHPETKQGGDRRSDAFSDQTEIISFCSSVAEKRDMSERHVRNLVRIGEHLDAGAARELSMLSKPPGYSQLAALTTLDGADQQAAVCLFRDGEERSLKNAIAKVGKGMAPNENRSAEDVFASQMMMKFDRAPMASKREFLAQLIDENRELIVQTMISLETTGDEE